jgi:uncharacterized protein (TIGR02231 family)
MGRPCVYGRMPITASFRVPVRILTIASLLAGCGGPALTGGPVQGPSASRVDPGVPKATAVSPVEDGDSVALASTVRKVTVYSDRAMITREANAKVTAAPTVYVFRQLPGWVDESSVRASTSTGRVLDLRVSRTYLAHATEQSYRKVEAESRDLTARVGALDDELKVLDAQTKQVEDIKAFSMDKLNKDVIAGNVGVPTYAAVVEFVAKTLRATAKARREVQAEREKLLPEIAASKRRMDELRGLTQLEETKVFVTVQGGGPADGQISLNYMLPGATWEAVHDLRTGDAGDPSSVELTSFAVVTQASGEDWNSAELTFSTQSSTAASRIPKLDALTLGDTRAETQSVERQSASFKRAETAFKGQNRLWNERMQSTVLGSNFEETYQTNFEYLQVVQSKTVEIFQSLQQRGTTAQFKAMSTTMVRADGRSVRVPIGRVRLKAAQAVVAAPEQSLNAAQTLEMLNETGQSLLPGKVSLYQGGAFLGMTNLGFVAEGEPFAVFLNVADQLKLTRALDKKHSAVVRKQRTQMQLAFIVTLENLSAKPMALKLADRIPVSEDRDIVISNVKISPDQKPDSKGILQWAVTLQPKEKRKFEIQYQIEYPPTLVVEMRRSKAQDAAAKQAAPATPGHPTHAAPAPATPAPRDLKHDIEFMEQQL